MNIYGYEKKLKAVNKIVNSKKFNNLSLNKQGKFKRMKKMYEHLLIQEREKQSKTKKVRVKKNR